MSADPLWQTAVAAGDGQEDAEIVSFLGFENLRRWIWAV
jgi:hypothetical protein